MKWFLPIVLFLTLECPSPAQAPRMTVRGQDGSVKLLRLEQAKVSVHLVGDVAETVLDLEFRNDGERAVEGEFALALPEGATVSGYALDVNGNMREGVVVEKERARNAYESVKRRMIDPGIVEREAGNIYRTKVYPVPARGTKRLSIRYLETLRTGTRGSDYSLPLDFPDTLVSFSCEITGSGTGGLNLIDDAGLEFAADGSGGFKAGLQNAKPKGMLKFSLKTPASARIIVENNERPGFYLTDRMPETAPRPRPAPDTVMLVWDASASGRDRDHKKEFALLDAWFAKLGKTRVKLRLLRDGLVDGGEFEIRKGRWQKLKQTLQQVDYDGATFLSRVKVSSGDADFVVLVSDGISSPGAGRPEITTPWAFVHSGMTDPAKSFFQWAQASSEAVIDLSSEDNPQALAKLIKQPLRLITVVGDDLENFLSDRPQAPGEPLRIFGSLKARRAGKLELRFGFGNEVITTRGVSYQPGGNADGIVRRLHAQRVLAQLEQEVSPNQKRIIDHCKRHGLVSDHTSFIVLELLQDYADHGISPPEAGLQDDYNKLVAKRAAHRAADLGGLSYAWSDKLEWFGRRFPGYEAMILPRVRQVGIWKTAVQSQFAPAQRDPVAFATIAGWFDKASGLIADKPKLRTKEDYENWRKAIDGLHAQGPELAKTALHPPPAGQVLAVSVRGLVGKPGVVTIDSAMTLRQSIDKAGGLHPFGSLDNIVLYRNAGKIVYNTLSDQYQDFPLFPGDMVVVGQQNPPWDYAMDPFAEAPPLRDVRRELPVREQGDLWISPSAGRAPIDPFGGGDNGTPAGPSAFPVTPATPTAIRPYSPPARDRLNNHSATLKPRRVEGTASGDSTVGETDSPDARTPDFASFEKTLAAGVDPETAYRKLRSNNFYQDRFHIETARMLFAKQHSSLARRVLSNIVESRPDDLSAVRAYAFWLAEFGQTEEAALVLGPLCENGPATLPPRLDLASIQAISRNAAAAAKTLIPALKDIQSNKTGSLAAIALTEYNALHRALGKTSAAHPLSRHAESYVQNLAADIRIVATSTGDGNSLRFEVCEPGGAVCPGTGSASPFGGRVSASGGIREYMIRRAVPGVYRITCASDHPVTVRLVLHTRWGCPDQESKVVTLLLDSVKMQQVGEIEFEFQADGK